MKNSCSDIKCYFLALSQGDSSQPWDQVLVLRIVLRDWGERLLSREEPQVIMEDDRALIGRKLCHIFFLKPTLIVDFSLQCPQLVLQR